MRRRYWRRWVLSPYSGSSGSRVIKMREISMSFPDSLISMSNGCMSSNPF